MKKSADRWSHVLALPHSAFPHPYEIEMGTNRRDRGAKREGWERQEGTKGEGRGRKS